MKTNSQVITIEGSNMQSLLLKDKNQSSDVGQVSNPVKTKPTAVMVSTAVGSGSSDSDDPFDRPPTKVVYGANTIQISCNMDEEEEKQLVDASTLYERQYAPFNNPGVARILE